jgi:hypothetical protein
MRILLSAFFVLVSTLPFHAFSANSIEAGKFIRDEGSGTLVIGDEKSGLRPFSIETVSIHIHTCSVDGVMKDGVARLKEDEEEPACIIKFRKTDEGTLVEPQANCQYYCGAGASFDGLYRKPIPECLEAAVKSKRDQARQAFDRKNYSQARDMLQPLVGKCDRFLDIMDHAWLRNDLALIFHKLGDRQGCLKMLEPIKDSMTFEDEDYRSYNPARAEERIKVAKATRHNLKICQSGNK